MDLGRYGLWSAGLRMADEAAAADAAAEVDELGYGTVWLPARGDGVFARAAALLRATKRLKVATGIVSIWTATPEEVSAESNALEQEFPGRFVLGLGVSHGPIVDREEAGRYRKPLTRMTEYLDELDRLPDGVPADRRILAANHPKMLRVAAERSLGSHTYLVPPEHTRWAREQLGQGPILAPEQGVVLIEDPEQARAAARDHLTNPYIGLPNYTKNWLAFAGADEDDLRDGGTDRLVDAIVAWGGIDRVVERIRAHHEAGADHVCIQVLNGDRTRLFRDEWRALAEALA
jgi:probable F420-dependent oxidoreductase